MLAHGFLFIIITTLRNAMYYSFSLQFFIMAMVLLNVKLVSLICRRSPRLSRFLATSATLSMWLCRQHWAESFRQNVKPLPEYGNLMCHTPLITPPIS